MGKGSLAAFLLFVACAIALTAWAQTDTKQYSYERDVQPIFLKACVDCHGSENPKKGLDLSKGNGYKALLGVKSQETEMPLLKAGDLAGSYLWLKLSHTTTEGKGMPRTLFGSKKLHDDQLNLIKSWIVAGAQP
jgi:mono/diheme cytochrome c family protein